MFTLFCFYDFVFAGLMHEVAEEEHSVVLRCPLSEERRVTWSRERHDSREEILTADGGRLIRHDDVTKQYTAYDDLSLYIYRAAVSHSGTYFCDDKAAVELTVIPSGDIKIIRFSVFTFYFSGFLPT